MKKLLGVVALLVISILFTSCIDYVQSITYKDGKYNLYCKITLSKVLLAMADADPDEFFDSYDEETSDIFPENVAENDINTDLEIGKEFRFAINPKTEDPDERAFLPTVSGNKYFIPFFLGSDDSNIVNSTGKADDEAAVIGQAILSSAKCRVIVSKKIIPSINKAYFEGDDNDFLIPFFDYGDSYCMEIPFVLLFEQDSYDFNRITIE